MNSFRIKQRISELWNYLRVQVGIPLMMFIALTGAFVIYTTIRDWQTEREIERTNERINKYDQMANQFIENANKYISQADADRAAMRELYGVVSLMNDNLERLAKRDNEITVKVNNSGNDYEKTRNQKRNSNSGVRNNLSLRQREDGVLAADRELYPN